MPGSPMSAQIRPGRQSARPRALRKLMTEPPEKGTAHGLGAYAAERRLDPDRAGSRVWETFLTAVPNGTSRFACLLHEKDASSPAAAPPLGVRHVSDTCQTPRVVAVARATARGVCSAREGGEGRCGRGRLTASEDPASGCSPCSRPRCCSCPRPRRRRRTRPRSRSRARSQSEAGCAGDWDPGCAATHLTYDAGDDVWQGTFSLPAGSYEYKAALNDSWDENYGLHAAPNGANIPLDRSRRRASSSTTTTRPTGPPTTRAR